MTGPAILRNGLAHLVTVILVVAAKAAELGVGILVIVKVLGAMPDMGLIGLRPKSTISSGIS